MSEPYVFQQLFQNIDVCRTNVHMYLQVFSIWDAWQGPFQYR